MSSHSWHILRLMWILNGMELLYNLTPLCGSEFPSIGNKRNNRSNSDPTNCGSTPKNSKQFIRILDQHQLFEIIQGSNIEMNCLRGTESTPTFHLTSYETLPKSFLRGGRDRQSFVRRSFHSVRKNVVRQSERFMGKHFKAKPKRSRSHDSNNNKNLNDLNNFSTYNDRTLPNSAICDIVFSSDKSVPVTTSTNHQSRWVNSFFCSWALALNYKDLIEWVRPFFPFNKNERFKEKFTENPKDSVMTLSRDKFDFFGSICQLLISTCLWSMWIKTTYSKL